MYWRYQQNGKLTVCTYVGKTNSVVIYSVLKTRLVLNLIIPNTGADLVVGKGGQLTTFFGQHLQPSILKLCLCCPPSETRCLADAQQR